MIGVYDNTRLNVGIYPDTNEQEMEYEKTSSQSRKIKIKEDYH